MNPEDLALAEELEVGLVNEFGEDLGVRGEFVHVEVRHNRRGISSLSVVVREVGVGENDDFT